MESKQNENVNFLNLIYTNFDDYVTDNELSLKEDDESYEMGSSYIRNHDDALNTLNPVDDHNDSGFVGQTNNEYTRREFHEIIVPDEKNVLLILRTYT